MIQAISMQTLKRVVLQSSKALGAFHLTRHFGNRGLNILCYHGFELEDEAAFRPKLFIRRDTFERRMQVLARRAVPVLALEEALHHLQRGTLPRGATVITIDDGFYSVVDVAAPILERHGFPATVYVTSYYVSKGTPIFRLAIQYMFWRGRQRALPSPPLERWREWTGDDGDCSAVLATEAGRDQLMWQIIRHGEERLGEAERGRIARQVGEWLGVDHEQIATSRILSLLSPDELRSLERRGIAVELHTHRHRFPLESSAAAQAEVAENRRVLEGILHRPLVHFCYPDGSWGSHQWPWLRDAGVQSATTCLSGRNYPDTPLLALRRYLDCEELGSIDFEAEVSGFSEMMRGLRGTLVGSHRRGARPAGAALMS